MILKCRTSDKNLDAKWIPNSEIFIFLTDYFFFYKCTL